jgi:hypothetical protein
LILQKESQPLRVAARQRTHRHAQALGLRAGVVFATVPQTMHWSKPMCGGCLRMWINGGCIPPGRAVTADKARAHPATPATLRQLQEKKE